MKDEAKERGSRQALEIEHAETEILALARKAALEIWSADRYRREVENVIKATKEKSVIADRIETPLKDYATKVLFREKQIVNYQATFFAFLLTIKDDTAPIEKQLGDTIKSKAFTKAVNIELREPSGIWNTGMPRQEYMNTYMRDVADMYRKLVAENAQEAYDSNVSLRNIAEMTVRYNHQIGMINDLKQKGVRLAWIIPHANCSKRCAKYQGKLYSLDGTEGDIDGIHFKPLEFATDNPDDQYITQKGIVYQNGCLTGFNCRHKLEEYTAGSKPDEIPAKEVEKQRDINDRQRAYERKIRYYKEIAIAASGTPDAAKARAKAKEITAEYEQFCKDNEVAYYPDRIKIL